MKMIEETLPHFVLIGQSLANLILFLNAKFLLLTSKMIAVKKKVQFFFFFLLFSFFNLSKLSGRGTPIFFPQNGYLISIEKTVNFRLCEKNPYKTV